MMKRVISANFLLSDFTPYCICFFLMFVPYLAFEPRGIFNFELYIPKYVHFLICLILIPALALSAYLGWRIGRKRLRIPVDIKIEGAYQYVLWLALAISIAAHLALLATSGAAFFRGGSFVSARQNFLFQGLGVFMRLYIPVLPLLAASEKRLRGLWMWTGVLGVLVLLRAIILSERLAVIEFAFTLWVVAKILRANIRLSHALLAAGALAGIFLGILALRIVTQRDAAVRDDAASFAGSSMVAYYADTQNKLYYYGITGEQFPEKAYMVPFSAFTRSKSLSYQSYDVYLSRMSLRTRSILPLLTNPGGMTVFIGDFGIPLGVTLACLSFFLSGYVIATIRALRLSTLLAGLVAIHIADFPRESFMELPFAVYVTVFAILLRVFQTGFVFRYYSTNPARPRPSRRSISVVPHAHPSDNP